MTLLEQFRYHWKCVTQFFLDTTGKINRYDLEILWLLQSFKRSFTFYILYIIVNIQTFYHEAFVCIIFC